MAGVHNGKFSVGMQQPRRFERGQPAYFLLEDHGGRRPPVGPPGHKRLSVSPASSLSEKRLSASQTFPEFQRAYSNSY